MKKTLLLLSIAFGSAIQAQITDPMIISWWFNTTGQTFTGTNGTAVVDVEAVYYSSSIVYVKSSGIPSYYADGASNFDGKDMTNVFKLPRTQTAATSATATPIIAEGSIGVLIDGSAILSPGDGKTYNNAGVWHQLAYSFEGLDFDAYNGHSTPQGQYHHHVDPNQLYNVSANTAHSPVIGYAFDGYPVYGPYGYTNTNGTGAIKQLMASWQVRNITSRTTLPDGSTASSAGPCVGMPPSCQPLGKYWEDYEYVSGSGDLDRHNGRFCVTPEYPSGTYCYFLSLSATLTPAFPYFIGDTIYGVVQSGNTGPTGGNNTVPGTATLYTPTTGVDNVFESININIFPNPVCDELNITAEENKNYRIVIYNASGKIISTSAINGRGKIDMREYASGSYVIEVIDQQSGNGYMRRIIK
jgi:hypothetical protein